MKTRTTLLTLFGACLSSVVFGQANNFSVFASDSLPTCTNGLHVYVEAGTIPESGGIIYIDWGDGSSEQFNFTTDVQINYFNDYYQHSYATSGYYTGNAKVWSGITNAFISTPQSFTLQAANQNACGYAYLDIFSSTQNINYYNIPVDFTDANGVTTTISPSSAYSYGYYCGLNTSNAPFTISLNDAWLAANNYTQITPDQQITTFNTAGYAGQYSFEISCGSALVNPDANIQTLFGNFVAPTQTGMAQMRVCNSSCSGPVDTQVEITFESFLTPDISALQNPVVAGNVLTFDLDDLQGCIWINIPFTLSGTIAAGTPVNLSATVTCDGTDLDPTNNTAIFSGNVLNSYDPNNKLVDKAHYINFQSKEKLQYLVNFQNEGNYPALNITVKDTISEYLDLSTFRFIEASHNATYTIDAATRVVTFYFPMINLPSTTDNEHGSKGSLAYSINELPGLALNSEIKNTAYIYFDFNPAIITNTTSNINSALGLTEMNSDLLNIYPNPASGKVFINTNTMKSVKLIDFTGKIVLNEQNSSIMDVSTLPDGIYLVEITTETGNILEKLVIQH